MIGQRGEPPPLVLVYHGVRDLPVRDDPHGHFVRPRDLVVHVRRLRVWGYRLATFGELAARVARGEGAGWAALTFDDGLADNLDIMLPLMRAQAAPATVFIVPGWLGQRHPHHSAASILDEDGVRALHAAGIEIGGHTLSHPDLTELSEEEARRELAGSRAALESMIDAPVTVAAYPSGRANDQTRRACADAGYAAACRNSGQGSWSDPFDLPRQDMQNGDTALGLWLKRYDRYEPLMRWRAARGVRRLVRMSRSFTRPLGDAARARPIAGRS